MKILVVEDDENKRVQIIEFLASKHPSVDVKVASSLMAGVKCARSERPDIIILDMTLPNYDLREGESGGGMHAFGGVELLKQLRRHKVDSKVIVFTQFETFGLPPDMQDLPELDKQLSEIYAPQYLGAVYYHASRADWVPKLDELIAAAWPGDEV